MAYLMRLNFVRRSMINSKNIVMIKHANYEMTIIAMIKEYVFAKFSLH